jgi:cobyrinic acid a,c-diamide synthase
MAAPEHIHDLFEHYGKEADVCVVEGMMGLFDGYDRDKGSSAEIASILGLPVVLVVDAKSAAYSMAPLLQGFVNFRKDVHIAGIIFNKVGSPRHFEMLRQVCTDLQITCYGYLPKDTSLEQGSRYLGLDFSEKAENDKLINLIESHVDWKGIQSSLVRRRRTVSPQASDCESEGDGLKVSCALNAESFSFIYQENIDSFASVSFFDPEKDVPSLEGIDLLYLPGGYPEKHLEALVKNEACRKAIRDYAEQGGRVVAECGGMMYLCEKIITDEGEYPMCGVLPYTITARKADRKLSLGYRRFMLDGKEYRGHEFHYTQFEETPESVTQVYNAKGEPVPTPVFRYKNVLASYTHLYQI